MHDTAWWSTWQGSVMIGLMILITGLLIWLIVRSLARRGTSDKDGGAAPVAPDGREDDAVAQARMRYARGEIDRADYARIVEDLTGPAPEARMATRAGPPGATTPSTRSLGGMPDDLDLLRRLDAYLDAVPRSAVRTETIGPFTLFVQEGNGWRYYARPTPGAEAFGPDDVTAVRVRQRELAQPEALEWVVGVAPGVGPATEAAGMATHRMPLMHLPDGAARPVPAPDGVEIRIVGPDDDLATIDAVAAVGFGAPGTQVGETGVEALVGAAAATDPGILAFRRERARDGLTVTAAAFVEGVPISIGSHQPCEGATEIVGVATLPAFRRRGIGGAVTATLIDDARERGVEIVFLSAGDQDIARVYARAGFLQVGEVGAAEPAPGPSADGEGGHP